MRSVKRIDTIPGPKITAQTVCYLLDRPHGWCDHLYMDATQKIKVGDTVKILSRRRLGLVGVITSIGLKYAMVQIAGSDSLPVAVAKKYLKKV